MCTQETLNLQHHMFGHLQWIFFSSDSVLIFVNGWIYCSFWKTLKKDKDMIRINTAKAGGMNSKFSGF